jgi:hypothetical protein
VTSEKPSATTGPDWDAIERDYSAGLLTVSEICALYAVPYSTIYYRIRTQRWQLRRASSPAGRRRTKANLTGRLLKALDLKMSQFEKRMAEGAASDSPADSERDARTLNALVRLFEKLNAIDANETPARMKMNKPALAPQSAAPALKDPLHADHIRGELARRLDKLRGQIGG